MEILVLVDLLVKSIATSSPCNGHVVGFFPAFMSCLWYSALVTRDLNSGVVKSEIEIKCLKVDDAVMADVEKNLWEMAVVNIVE